MWEQGSHPRGLYESYDPLSWYWPIIPDLEPKEWEIPCPKCKQEWRLLKREKVGRRTFFTYVCGCPPPRNRLLATDHG